MRRQLPFLLLLILLAVSCNDSQTIEEGGTVPGAPAPHRLEPCSEQWDEHVENVLTTGDGMGHGPDLGSDEWKSVIEFKLGVRGNVDVPDRSSKAWCLYIDQRLSMVGGQPPS